MWQFVTELRALEPGLWVMRTTPALVSATWKQLACVSLPAVYSTVTWNLVFLFLRFSIFSCSLCLHLAASHSSRSAGDKDPVRRYWNKWPPALLSTGSTQLNLMLGCPCVFFLSFTNKLIYSNFLMSPFASASSVVSSTLLWGCARLGWHPLINQLIRPN